MNNILDIEAVLDGGLDALLNPAGVRRKAGAQLPIAVAVRLLSYLDQEVRNLWADKLVSDVWATVREERGGRWELGWAELTGGLALAIELLSGELPPVLRDELKGTAAETEWQHARRPYQRFVLLVDSSVHIKRILSTPQLSVSDELMECSPRWMVDGPAFRDRSHTLMLALMADNALSAELVPVAATGVLHEDGEHVGRVGSLDAKVQAWWQQYAEGLLISAPPNDHDPQTWRSLLASSTKTRGAQAPQWIVGATLSEIKSKLLSAESQQDAWDGSSLARDAVLTPRLAVVDLSAPERIVGDPLFDACWAAWRDAQRCGARRGVILNGAPGSGKSVFSLSLGEKFARGPLSPLGYGVRRAARDLAADIKSAPPSTWASVLARREPELLPLFKILEETNRLVPIVDGLDELLPEQLSAVSEWLRRGKGWWFATSRPISALKFDLPDAWTLQIEDLNHSEASRLLTALNRRDLADQLGLAKNSGLLDALTRTPLQLTLLVKVCGCDEDVSAIAPHDLYERVFNGLLDHACCSQRLTSQGATFVRLHNALVGELALSWLISSNGYLSSSDVNDVLAKMNIKLWEQNRAMEALSFGHLLVGAGAGWEFGHRTIAEWAAAKALHRRASDAVQSECGDDREKCAALRGSAEVKQLDKFLEDGILVEHGRWGTLIRFYVAYSKEPLALLERLIGPAYVTGWKMPVARAWRGQDYSDCKQLRSATSSEVLDSWSFAFELMCSAKWNNASDAQKAWGLAVRRWLLVDLNKMSYPNYNGYAVLQAFTAAVGRHLPHSLEEMIELAAQTPGQKTRITSDPCILLPAVPAIRAEALFTLLERGDVKQQIMVINWFKNKKINPNFSILNKLLDKTQSQINKQCYNNLDDSTLLSSSTTEDTADLLALEAAIWGSYLLYHEEIPWNIVEKTISIWPEHLDKLIVQWFGSTRVSDTTYNRQQKIFASVLATAVDEEAQFTCVLMDDELSLESKNRILGRVRYYFNDGDNRPLKNLVDNIAFICGFTRENYWENRPIDEENIATNICKSIRRLKKMRERSFRLISVIKSREHIDSVIGSLWSILDPSDTVRKEILIALMGHNLIPQQVPVEDVLKYYGSATWRLKEVQWTSAQVEALRSLSAAGIGQVRYNALCVLSHLGQRDELMVLTEQLPSDDEIFSELVYESMSKRRSAEGAHPPVVPDPSRLPLDQQAALKVSGWRVALLSQLGDCSKQDITELIKVAVQYHVSDALALLTNRLGQNKWNDSSIIQAITQLASDRDEVSVRLALRAALRSGWPYDRAQDNVGGSGSVQAGAVLARYLQVEDLKVLAEGSISALKHPSLADGIRGLGPAAHEELMRLHSIAARDLIEVEARRAVGEGLSLPPEPPELKEARGRRDALAETIIASVDAATSTPKYLVDLLQQIAGGDIHQVFGTTGSLGSDFNEPGDMDWHSSQENESFIKAAIKALEESITRYSEDWQELRRLFLHPSDSLRKRSFEICADRAAPHEVAALALEALEGHIRENKTEFTGQLAGFFLAVRQSGAGYIYVASPDTAKALVEAVFARLTAAHRDVISTLSRHQQPAFRALAAKWTSELGTPGDQRWIEIIQPLLYDAEQGVIRSAVVAMAKLAPAVLDKWIISSDIQRWSFAHDQTILQELCPKDSFDMSIGKCIKLRKELINYISEQALVITITHAADRSAKLVNPDKSFLECPSRVEQVLDAWPVPLGDRTLQMLSAWLEHPLQAVREVGRRVLAGRNALDGAVVRGLLCAPEPIERFSGAECAVRMGFDEVASDSVAVLRGILAEAPTPQECTAAGLRQVAPRVRTFRRDDLGTLIEEQSLHARLRWALKGVPTVKFAELLPLIAGRIPFDSINDSIEPEGEEIIKIVCDTIKTWGREGAAVFLEMLDKQYIEDNYFFKKLIESMAILDKSIFDEILKRSDRGEFVSADILEDLKMGIFDQNLVELVNFFELDIFPNTYYYGMR